MNDKLLFPDNSSKICKMCGKHENTHVGVAKACFGGIGTVFISQSEDDWSMDREPIAEGDYRYYHIPGAVDR